MKKQICLIFFLLGNATLFSQSFIVPGENLVLEGIPEISSDLPEEVRNYTEARGASLIDWHPFKKEMLISTRFGNSNQLHLVSMPGGARKQLTFFNEPVGGATFEPNNGDYFLFTKDIGGNEFSQIFKYDMFSKKTSRLTDGKRSQNGGIHWNTKGDRIAYSSTRRNGKDRDIYIMNPFDSASNKLVCSNDGGGWGMVDWSPDDNQLLLSENVSVNESRLYLLDLKTGVKTRMLPEKDERTTFYGVEFSADKKGVFLITNVESEFNRLAFFDFEKRKINPLTKEIFWDVTDVSISKDGRKIAFVTNEAGISRLYLMDATTYAYSMVPNLPEGSIGGINWTADSKSLGFTFGSFQSSSDVFELNTETKTITRWTESEMGGMDISALPKPVLMNWPSFDGKTISGFLFKPNPKFTGKRPVIISVHGGPEGQSKPTFQGRVNFFLNEMGIAIIYPNVRGSTGFGKTFTDLDNGMKREESVKDIGALLDWIAKQPDLDKDRIMVTGGSYGGYMALAVSCQYSDKIRCAIDVVGISNFNTFLKNTESYRKDLRRVEYGDERIPEMAAFLENISPLNQTDKITKPLFIIQGGNDPRVPASEAIQMKDKLKAQGKPVWFLMAKDEGHGFRKKDNIDFQFYSTVAFIRKYLVNN